MKRINLLLVFVILIAFVIRLIISWTEVPILIEKILLDDSLYVISVAKNIAWGNGVTYNGVDITNGFQPLWGVILIPVFLMTRNIYLAINLVLTVASIIDTLTVFLIFKLSKKIFNEKIGIISAAFYGLNPMIIFQTLCGIEVVLYVFLILVTLLYYNKLNKKLENRNAVILGTLLGLTILARMDGIFLALIIILHVLWKDKKNLINGIRKSIIVIFLTALIVAPWFLWNYFTFGTIIQSSAIAKYNMGHGIFPFFDLKEPKNMPDSASMIAENFIRSLGAILHQLGIVDFNLNIITIIISLFFLATFIFSLKIINKLKLYVLFSILLILFYNLYLWGIQIRYLAAVIPLIIIIVSHGFYNLVIKVKKSDVLLTAIFVLFLLALFSNGLKQWEHGYFSWQKEIYKDALWLKGNTLFSDSIGIFSAGIPIYFSERRVVNLDGVVNFNAIKALEDKNVIGYMKSENITIWMDSVYFNTTVTKDYLNGRKIDIVKENIWTDFLGSEKDKLELLEQRENIYSHLRGFDMVVVFFKARVN